MPENFHDAKASKDAFTIYSKTKKGFIALIKGYNETEKYPVEREFLKGRLPTNNGLVEYHPNLFEENQPYEFKSEKGDMDIVRGYFCIIDGEVEYLNGLEQALELLGIDYSAMDQELEKLNSWLKKAEANTNKSPEDNGNIKYLKDQIVTLMTGEETYPSGAGLEIIDLHRYMSNSNGTIFHPPGEKTWLARITNERDDKGNNKWSFVQTKQETEQGVFYDLKYLEEGFYIMHHPFCKDYQDRLYLKIGKDEIEIVDYFIVKDALKNS